jgi:hypothetical protein
MSIANLSTSRDNRPLTPGDLGWAILRLLSRSLLRCKDPAAPSLFSMNGRAVLYARHWATTCGLTRNALRCNALQGSRLE